MSALLEVNNHNYSFSATSSRVCIYLAQQASESIYVDFLDIEDVSKKYTGANANQFAQDLKKAHLTWVSQKLWEGEITEDALMAFLPKKYACEIINKARSRPQVGVQF